MSEGISNISIVGFALEILEYTYNTYLGGVCVVVAWDWVGRTCELD